MIIEITKCKATGPFWPRMRRVWNYLLSREVVFSVQVSKEQADEFIERLTEQKRTNKRGDAR